MKVIVEIYFVVEGEKKNIVKMLKQIKPLPEHQYNVCAHELENG